MLYCILTTAPNASHAAHPRPDALILTGEQRQRWLADADAATEILTVVPPELTPRVSGGSDQPVVERYGRGGAPSEKK